MYLKSKRIFDIIFSIIFIILFGWLLILISLAIYFEDGKSVLFKQRRIGINKKEFIIYKFRTMRKDTPSDVPTHLLQNAGSHITKVGKLLRRSSLDELPQLFNILKGDMSFVGPRPALYNQYDLIEERDKYNANSITPGLTGLAQVSGRDELPVDVKAKFDGEYVTKMSLLFDIKILVMTVFSVFTAKGVIEGAIDDEDHYHE